MKMQIFEPLWLVTEIFHHGMFQSYSRNLSQMLSVLDDIVSTMFNRRFIEEIFLKHQPLHSKRMLRAMFDKLAHASIMRLNTQSMDKVSGIILKM
jgi:hypothetical protein